MDKVPNPVVRGIPVLPVALALLVGFSLGLAVSIVAGDFRPIVPAPVPVPCRDCADKKAAVVEPVAPSPSDVPAPVTVDRSADVPG